MLLEQSGKRDPWKIYHKRVVDFIRVHFPGDTQLTWVEIGTAFGMTTDYVLSRLPNAVARVVDPLRAGYDMKDNTARVLNNYRKKGNMTFDEFSSAWAGALISQQKQQQRACRYQIHRNMSTDGAEYFANASIDVLFVDGLHTYAGVMNDLVAYWPKLKPQSLLILNDWTAIWACPCRHSTHKPCHCAFPGVKRAGCTFLATKGLATRIVEQGPVGLTNAAVVIGIPSKAKARNGTCDAVLKTAATDSAGRSHEIRQFQTSQTSLPQGL